MKTLNGLCDWVGDSGDTDLNAVVVWNNERPITYGKIQDNARRIRYSEKTTEYMEALPKNMECNAKLQEASSQFYKKEAESQKIVANIKRTKGQLILGFVMGCGAVVLLASRINGYINAQCPHLGYAWRL